MDRPIVFITIAYILGIVIGKLANLPLWFSILFFLIFLFLTLYAYFQRLNIFLCLLILFCLVGMLNYQTKALTTKDIYQIKKESKAIATSSGFHKKFNEVLTKILPNKEASLLGSILLGTSVSPISEEAKNDYRKAGLIHLLVVSGTQVSILIGVCLSVMRALRLPLWLGVLTTSVFNLLLTIVTGAGPSILRAAIMGEITLIGLLFEREKEFYTSLALSALILLIVNPLNLFDIGFQLSFAATWGLVYMVPVLQEKIPPLLSISLAPLLATSPIIVYYFGQVSVGAIISNLLMLPWIEFLVILGFATTLLGFLFLPLAKVMGGTIWLMLLIMDWIARGVANFPGACFYVKSPTFPLVVGYYASLVIFIEMLRRKEEFKITPKRSAVAFLLIISVFIWHTAVSADLPWQKHLTVTFLDVGQGDSALIETPNGKKVLIDGGGVEREGELDIWIGGDREIRDPVGTKVVLPFLRKKGINKLDLVILTHPHEDHVGGLNEVLKEIKVDQVLDSGQIYESVAYRNFLNLVKRNKIKYSAASAGQIINFEEGIKGYILHPSCPFIQDTKSDANNNSIVMRLVYGNVSFLFTGDLEREGEERILMSNLSGQDVQSPRSQVLKIAHHGSSTSTSDEFLKAVAPEATIISVGKYNHYFHPHPSTLKRLKNFGVKLYRTDKNGTITVRTNGSDLFIEPQR